MTFDKDRLLHRVETTGDTNSKVAAQSLRYVLVSLVEEVARLREIVADQTPCPDCHGEGHIPRFFPDGDFTCPNCKGTGKLKA